MKSEKCGVYSFSNGCIDGQCSDYEVPIAYGNARWDYVYKRLNGRNREIPGDGKYEWTKGWVNGRHVVGVRDVGSWRNVFEVRYDEGPKDKEFMEEGDWEYIQDLMRKGELLAKEPNADEEIALDHKYREQIIHALKAARAGCRSIEEFEAKKRARELERLQTEAQTQLVRVKKEAAKAQEYAARCSATIEALQKTAETASADVEEVRRKADIVGIEAGAVCTSAVERGLEVKKQLKRVTDVYLEVQTQNAAVLDLLRRAEEVIRTNPTDVEGIRALADDAAKKAEEIRKSLEAVPSAGEEIEKQSILIAEIKRQVTASAAQKERRATPPPTVAPPAVPVTPVTPIPPEPQTPERHIDYEIPHTQLRLGAEIGKGSYGIVYRGTYHGAEVAVKQLHIDKVSEVALKEFQSEAQLMKSVDFPRVVHLFGICIEPGHYSMVMEYLPRGTLYNVLHSVLPLTWGQRCDLALDVGRGLSFLHSKGIIHRDLKSPNVLLEEKEGRLRAKISDFGLARIKRETKAASLCGSSLYTATGSVERKRTENPLGTLPWMAPELVTRSEIPKYTTASDVYAYALVLLEIATRKFPYEDEDFYDSSFIIDFVSKGNRASIPDDCPSRYAAIIARCWAQRAEDRPKVEEAVRELEEYRASIG